MVERARLRRRLRRVRHSSLRERRRKGFSRAPAAQEDVLLHEPCSGSRPAFAQALRRVRRSSLASSRAEVEKTKLRSNSDAPRRSYCLAASLRATSRIWANRSAGVTLRQTAAFVSLRFVFRDRNGLPPRARCARRLPCAHAACLRARARNSNVSHFRWLTFRQSE